MNKTHDFNQAKDAQSNMDNASQHSPSAIRFQNDHYGNGGQNSLNNSRKDFQNVLSKPQF